MGKDEYVQPIRGDILAEVNGVDELTAKIQHLYYANREQEIRDLLGQELYDKLIALLKEQHSRKIEMTFDEETGRLFTREIHAAST